MTEDISVQILSQASENIQKLFELSTRIDERVKAIHAKQTEITHRIDGIIDSHNEIIKKVAVLESKTTNDLEAGMSDCQRELRTLDKRLAVVELLTQGQQDKWRSIANFVIQLVWIVLAAWVLMKMNLSPPPIP